MSTPGGPLGRAIVVIIGAIAELERNLIIERVRAGMGRAKLEGRQIGLEGRHFFDRWPGSLDESAREFQKAIARAPTFAPAYSGLALTYDSLGFFRPPNEVFPKAKASALKALEPDPTIRSCARVT